jgi:hypothetical protein
MENNNFKTGKGEYSLSIEPDDYTIYFQKGLSPSESIFHATEPFPNSDNDTYRKNITFQNYNQVKDYISGIKTANPDIRLLQIYDDETMDIVLPGKKDRPMTIKQEIDYLKNYMNSAKNSINYDYSILNNNNQLTTTHCDMPKDLFYVDYNKNTDEFSLRNSKHIRLGENFHTPEELFALITSNFKSNSNVISGLYTPHSKNYAIDKSDSNAKENETRKYYQDIFEKALEPYKEGGKHYKDPVNIKIGDGPSVFLNDLSISALRNAFENNAFKMYQNKEFANKLTINKNPQISENNDSANVDLNKLLNYTTKRLVSEYEKNYTGPDTKDKNTYLYYEYKQLATNQPISRIFLSQSAFLDPSHYTKLIENPLPKKVSAAFIHNFILHNLQNKPILNENLTYSWNTKKEIYKYAAETFKTATPSNNSEQAAKKHKGAHR